MRNRRLIPEFPPIDSRRGATLSEVLIAILIMGIGLVGVISLFPAAVMRSVQAHTLTVGTGLRFNAESMLRIHPELLLNPDRADLNGNGLRYDDQAYKSNYDPNLPGRATAFMVDPLGIIQHVVADGAPVCTIPAAPVIARMQRFGAGYTGSIAVAENVFSGLDQWTVRHEGFPTTGNLDPSSTTQSVTISRLGAQSIFIGGATGIPTRAVIFNKDGTACQIRDLTAATPTQLTDTISWTNSQLPTPYSNATFTDAEIGNVRVEQRDLRFTWLMTARGKTPAGAGEEFIYDVDIVVFYKRGYPPGDIVGYTNTGAAPNMVFRQNSVDVVVNWDPGTTAAPFLKRGSFVLDAQNGYWYRVENYVEGVGTATITLATPARSSGRIAVFMKGIVDVFPVRQVTLTNPGL